MTKVLAVFLLAVSPRAASACQALLSLHHPLTPRVVGPTTQSLLTCGGAGLCLLGEAAVMDGPSPVQDCVTPGGGACVTVNPGPPSFELRGNGNCSAVPGSFSCTFEGGGEVTATLELRVTYPAPLPDFCTVTVEKPLFLDAAPPSAAFVPNPNGKVLSSTESVTILAQDEAMVTAVAAGPSVLGAQFVWGSPNRADGGPDNIFNYPALDATKSSVTVPFPLLGYSGRVTLAALAYDVPLHESPPATAAFDVDAAVPTIRISTPLLASPAGALFPIAGTAADDLGLDAVEVAVKDERTGLWWSGGAFTAEGEAWAAVEGVSGTESPWVYDGLAGLTLPLTGAVWTVFARARDVYGRLAQTQASVTVAPADRIKQVKGYEDEGFNLPPVRLDGEKRASTACTDPSSGKAHVTTASGGNAPQSPAMNIATSFLGEADGVWGWGWVSEHDQSLRLRPSGAVLYTDGAGRRLNFFPPAPGAADPDLYRSPAQDFRTLRVTERSNGAPTRFELREKDAAVLAFARTPGTPNFPLALFSDRNGNTLGYEPDAQGRLGVVRDRHGRTLTVAYDAATGRVESVTDDSGLAGRVVRYYYDAAGRRTSESGPKGTTLYDYEVGAATRIARVTFPNAGYRAFTYDTQGRVTVQTDLLDTGLTAETRYDYFPSSTVVTAPGGKVTTLDMTKKSGLKRPVRVEAPGAAVSFSQYDPATFNLTRSSDPLGRTTDFGYDDRGNVTSVAGPENVNTTLVYDTAFNRPISIVNPRGIPTALGYDPANGNLLSVDDPLRPPTLLTYDPFGHVRTVTDPDSNLTDFGYTGGQLTSVTDAEGRATVLTRDRAGRVTQAEDPEHRFTRYGYDDEDNLTDITDDLGGVTVYGYEPGPDGQLLKTVMDARQEAGGRKTTTFHYDKAGRLKSVTDPNGLVKSYQYDDAGNLSHAEDAKHQPFDFSYDAQDRLDKKTTPDGLFDFDFDKAGNLTRAQHPNGSVLTQTFDGQNRPTVVVQTLPNGHAVTLTNHYDENGNRDRLTTPWGTFAFHFDALDRVDQVSPPGTTGYFTIDYDPAGRRRRLTYPHPDVRADYLYDRAGLLKSVEHVKIAPTLTLLARSSYSYDDAGNRLTMTDLNGTHGYGYDRLHRLTRAQHHPMAALQHNLETFDYDKVGNRLAGNGVGGYSYDDGNRMLGNSQYTFGHDDNGNITSRTELATSETATLSYDAENRLIRVDRPDGAFVTLKYDALGRRVEKSVTAGPQTMTRRFVYDGEDILAVLDENNALVAWFAHGPGIDEPLMMLDQGRPRYLFADGLGSITTVTERDGTVIERIEYEAYGTPTFIDLTGPTPVYSQAPVTANMQALGGRIWDPEIGLYDHRARTRDPETGAFLQADPIGILGGLNLFAFVGNSPTNRIDPSGRDYLTYSNQVGVLTWVFEKDGVEIGRKIWAAGSGTQGLFQSIPPGTYFTSPSDREDKGAVASWGPFGYRLHEGLFTRIVNRRLHGRDAGFFIHGGFYPGTAGCIEFKDYDFEQKSLYEFDQLIQQYGKQIQLNAR